jgi:outer membrane lipoprotein-sorting protein
MRNRAAVLILVFMSFIAALPGRASDDVLERSRALYASLSSYADTGFVLSEYGSAANPSRDRHTFSTYFNRKPRGFVFDFTKQGGDRYVIWADAEAFHTWWKTTGGVDHFPNPGNTGAFIGSGAHTASAASVIPPLLYARGALSGEIADIQDAVPSGTEDVGGRKCARYTGTLHDTYATGREVNRRKITVWIDSGTLLVLKVVEEWPPLPGQISRVTTTFVPQSNPKIDPTRFRFTPPTQG